MQHTVASFLLKGILLFLLLELLSIPFREPLLSLLRSIIPPPFDVEWSCTALDEVFLYLSFVSAYPSQKNKLPVLILGTLTIELYNVLRILILVRFPDPLLHELFFRWGGFLLLLFLFYASFKYLSSRR